MRPCKPRERIGVQLHYFFNLGSRLCWAVKVTLRPFNLLERKGCWVLVGPIWTGAGNLHPVGFDCLPFIPLWFAIPTELPRHIIRHIYMKKIELNTEICNKSRGLVIEVKMIRKQEKLRSSFTISYEYYILVPLDWCTKAWPISIDKKKRPQCEFQVPKYQ
jgi:hypothetical protein